MEHLLIWGQDHLLAIVAVAVTIFLIYLYLLERDTGIKLSKKYRNSIYEAQSKVFLNATQYLISENKDLAIKELLNAVDINRETIETYFALGGLFRSNGEIEKAISIHRSLIAREYISESTRIRALKELAVDFDKGGFIDKAIETYQDVLEVNPDDEDVILSLCRILENVEDWDKAYEYRIILSKVGRENQAETISHILTQKAKRFVQKGDFATAHELLDEAFRFAPSVSAKILQLKILIIRGSTERAETLLIELLKEHPMYASFLFVSLKEKFQGSSDQLTQYQERLEALFTRFISMNDSDLGTSASVTLSKVRLLKEEKKFNEAYVFLQEWMETTKEQSEVLKVEYVKLLLMLGHHDQAVAPMKELLDNWQKSVTRHYCEQCGYDSDEIFWRCPQCYQWETIKFRWVI